MALPENFLPASQGQGNSIYYRDIDLSIARAGIEFQVPGFSFMLAATEAFDANGDLTYSTSTGLMLIQLGNSSATKLLMKSGSEFNLEPATSFFVTNAAQPGKMLRVYTATYPFLHQVPQFNASPSSGSSISVGANFATVQANGASQTLLAPGANLAGIILRHYSIVAATVASGLFVGTGAPTGPTDNTKRMIASIRAGQNLADAPNLQIPAGQGVYFWSNGAEVTTACGIGWDTL